MSKRMMAQIKPHTFDAFDPISFVGFLFDFKVACDTRGAHEEAAMWLFHFITKKSAFISLNTRLASKPNARTRVSSKRKIAPGTTYPQVVVNLLQTYTTDENISVSE